MEKHKMTKHDMKEDKFVTTMFQGASIAKDNLQSVIILVLVLVVLVAGVVLLRNYNTSRTENAQTLLGLAQVAYKAGEFAEARDSLLSLTATYPKSNPAKIADFMLGHIYYSSGSPDSAEIYWKTFIESKFKDPELLVAAKAGLAGILADRSDFKAAAVEFEKLYYENETYFNREDLLYKAAINYKAAGDREKMKELFKKFADNYPESPLIVKVKFFLSAAEAA